MVLNIVTGELISALSHDLDKSKRVMTRPHKIVYIYFIKSLLLNQIR